MRLLSIGLLALACALRPTRARCPRSMDLRTGIRLDGHFECWPRPSGPTVYERVGGGEWRWVDHSTQMEGWIEARIYCTGSSVPIVVDYRTVGCQPRYMQ